MEIKWQDSAKAQFNKIIQSLPQFHRTIAEKLVQQKAEEIAALRNSTLVEEKDLAKAFFQEVPPAFSEMMKRLFEHLNIDYSKYIEKSDK
jgi:hypothetical protein